MNIINERIAAKRKQYMDIKPEQGLLIAVIIQKMKNLA